jgi:hypothetical protein
MPSTLWTLLVAAVTAVVTALGEVRSSTRAWRPARNGWAGPHCPRHPRREHAADHLRLLTAIEIRAAPADDPEWTPVMRERLANERNRWLQQLDDAIGWLCPYRSEQLMARPGHVWVRVWMTGSRSDGWTPRSWYWPPGRPSMIVGPLPHHCGKSGRGGAAGPVGSIGVWEAGRK